MNEDEILATVRQLAAELRKLPAGSKVTDCEAYKRLQSQPGKGGPLMQWFNRENVQSRKNIISEILGHFARAAYQQKPEFNQNAANELVKLCDRLQPAEIHQPLATNAPPSVDDAAVKLHQAIALWNAGGLSWAGITKQLGEEADTWKAFSQAVKRYAAKTQQTLRSGKAGPKRPANTKE